MANSRILLVCKHCGEELVLGKGYFGEYMTYDDVAEKLDEFFQKHKSGECDNSTSLDFSDDAKNHFVVLEECDKLEDVIADIPQSREELLEWNLEQEREQIKLLRRRLATDKKDIAKEIFEKVDELLLQYSTPILDSKNKPTTELNLDIYNKLDELEDYYK